MKLIETIVTLATLAATGLLVLTETIGRGAEPLTVALAIAALVLALANLAIRPLRWQMIPVYLLVLAILAMLVLDVRPDGVHRYVVAAVGGASCALTAVLAAGMPISSLPEPDGPFAVGSTRLELTRPTGSGGRRLLVKVWYPAAAAEATTVQAREPLWSEFHGVPGLPILLRLLTCYLREVKTHARVNAPIRSGDRPYPVIVYNHALVSIPSENTLLMEALASQGYIVVGPSYADQMAEHVRVQRGVPAEERAKDKARYRRLRATSERAERGRIMAEAYRESTGMPVIVQVRSEDTAFVLDEIETVLAAIPGCEDGAPADLARIGAMGFSLGGAVATVWSKTDRRCRAVVNIDGGLFGDRFEEPSPVPYLMMYSGTSVGANDVFKESSGALFEEAVAPGSKHLDFGDATVVWPLLKWIGALGPTPGAELVRFKNERIRAFFDTHLERQASGTRPPDRASRARRRGRSVPCPAP